MRAAPKSWRAAPNDRTFAHLAWGYGQIGDVAGVTATAGLMAEAGVSLRPNSEARNALVRACRECGLPAAHVDRMVENLGDAAPARGRALGRAQEEERRGGGRKERREGRSDEGREARGRREGDAKADTGGGAGGAAARRRPPQRRRGVGVLLRRRG